MAKMLGRTITEASRRGSIQGIIPTLNCLAITHNQFMDDIILVGEVGVIKAKHFKGIIKDYEKASRYKVKYDKTRIYFLNTPINR